MSMAAMSKIVKESEPILLTIDCSNTVGVNCAVRNMMTHELPTSQENHCVGSGTERGNDSTR
jgi:hypothetical protein